MLIVEEHFVVFTVQDFDHPFCEPEAYQEEKEREKNSQIYQPISLNLGSTFNLYGLHLDLTHKLHHVTGGHFTVGKKRMAYVASCFIGTNL